WCRVIIALCSVLVVVCSVLIVLCMAFFPQKTHNTNQNTTASLPIANSIKHSKEKLMKLPRILFIAFLNLVHTKPLTNSKDDDGKSNRFDWVNLVSDLGGVARRTDPNLVNPWGLVIAPNGAIWVADNGAGVATVYNS